MNGAGQQLGVSTDTVVPLGIFDEAILKRLTVIYTTFLFNGVLDPIKLRSSLEGLIEKDGWNKLGARLRRNVSVLVQCLQESCTNSSPVSGEDRWPRASYPC